MIFYASSKYLTEEIGDLHIFLNIIRISKKAFALIIYFTLKENQKISA